MKEALVTIALCTCFALVIAASCGDEEETVTDAGGVSPEETEAYFGFVEGSKTYTGTQTVEGSDTPIDYKIEISVDTQTFTGKRTILRKWRANETIEMLSEWFEALGDKLYLLRRQYVGTDSQVKEVSYQPGILYGKKPWSPSDNPLSTSVGGMIYEYSIASREGVTVPAGTFDDALKIYTKEAGNTGLYYLVPEEGVVKFQLNGYPGTGTIEQSLKE